jgi:hypothetical protein
MEAVRTDQAEASELVSERHQVVRGWVVTVAVALGLGVLALPWVPDGYGPAGAGSGTSSTCGVFALLSATLASMTVRRIWRSRLLRPAGRTPAPASLVVSLAVSTALAAVLSGMALRLAAAALG